MVPKYESLILENAKQLDRKFTAREMTDILKDRTTSTGRKAKMLPVTNQVGYLLRMMPEIEVEKIGHRSYYQYKAVA